jgi:5'-nucleotidase
MKRTRLSVTAALAVLAVLVLAVPALGAPPPKQDKDTSVQLLAFNDFHGHVKAVNDLGQSIPGTIQVGQRRVTNPNGTTSVVNDTVNAGGAEYLSAAVKALRTTNANTITVGSGDLIGASPLLSGLFHDEPAIEALNILGLDVSGIGNHEFDEGLGEVYRMMNGGCHPVDGCQDGTPFLGSIFGYLAANVFFAGTDETVLPPYEIRKVDNAKIAFIGMTLEGTPLVVTPSAIAGLEFRDEVETANKLVAKLRAEEGVRSFVILLHEGGIQNAPFSNADAAQGLPGWAAVSSCDNLSGPIVDIANGLDDQVDVIVSGHTHQQYVCAGANEIDGKLVTSAASFGRLVTDIDLVIDHQTKDITSKTAQNVIVRQTGLAQDKDPLITQLIAHWDAFAGPIGNRVVGFANTALCSVRDAGCDALDGSLDGEAPLGNVIADSQLDATSPTDFGGAVIAFMNPGGIRAPLNAGEVTYEELFNVQPFGNTLTVKTCTGAQIQALLEQQQFPGRILTVSRGFNYTWDALRPAGDKVLNETVKLNGNPIVDTQSYRVEMNNFLASGGDGFSVFNVCTNQLGGEVDLDAVVRYFQAHNPLDAPTENRITRLN